MSTYETFVLRALDTDVALLEHVEYPVVPAPDAIDHHYAIKTTVSATQLENLFKFSTTDPELTSDISDADMSFNTDSSVWEALNLSFSTFVPHLATDNALKEANAPNGLAEFKKHSTTKELGVSRIAKQITGGYNNSDIFTNESELVDQYTALDVDINAALKIKIDDAKDKTNEDVSNNNIVRELVNYLAGGSPAQKNRLHEMIEGHDNESVPFVFVVGDKIEFRLIYKVDNLVENPGLLKATTGYGCYDDAPASGIAHQLSRGGIAKNFENVLLGNNSITDQVFKVIIEVV